jgi:hypothetical protein
MSEGRWHWRRLEWEMNSEFNVPSADLGIPFLATVRLRGDRPRRLPEDHVIVLAGGFAVDAVAASARRFSVLFPAAAGRAAAAACLSTLNPNERIRILAAEVELSTSPKMQAEARRLAVLRRAAELAGREAVSEAAKAAVAASVESEDEDKDDGPEQRWLDVAVAIHRLVDRRNATERKETMLSLADWAEIQDKALAEALRKAVG